jgi:lipid-binding SYLF domain-containing protein
MKLFKWMIPLTLIGAAAWADISVDEARATLDSFKRRDPDMQQFFTNAAAYVVFPTVKKGAFVVGGAGGDGILFEGGAPVGTVKMTQLSVGAQIGGQTYSEVVFLQDKAALYRLKRGETSLSASASAVAADQQRTALPKWENGVSVFTMPISGAMAEASIGGQKFEYHPFARPPRS